MDVRFFPDGNVHIHSLWEDDGNSYSETGTYTYSSSNGKLEIRFDPEVSFAEISSVVGGDPAAFIAEGINLVRQDTKVLPAGLIALENVTGEWIMYYRYEDELVEVTLNLESSGSFVETTRYFQADDDLIETGRFEIDRQTGLIFFYYSTNPDYAYRAYYDTRREALYTYDGDFNRGDSR